MTSRPLAALALAGITSLSCATPGEPAPGPPPFTGVRKIALVRWRADPAAPRPKDALDALAESLAARSYETRLVEIGPRSSNDLRPLERLHARVEAFVVSAAQGGQIGRARRRAERAGAEAADAVRQHGVDAVAMLHRFDERFPPPFSQAPAGSAFPRAPGPPARPTGALSLVDRDGSVIWFEWGAPGAELDPTAAVNAAEAIDLLLRALAGEPDED